ncbi:carbohydrate esterase family 1 protein [Annulohypoxylon truncatum]|uniref:carbohydrate esterase family 1 protein n=1 Tax=Annulohypoxylon truncatum TaxID=327061 RepID=UPI002008A051|nr:carbohydrate esterase family 1 protein [Annulohypoxylon truncatum]KAI1207721.1 carbohydrate esterase family 1 protein [Annulohypoxylon truncatum]
MRGVEVTSALATLLSLSTTHAALTQVTDWGENPTSLDMQVYLPAKLAEKPAIVLALHYCGGTGPAYYQMANYDTYADAQGFIVVYPSTKKDSNCWDVASEKTLTNNGGGDSTGLVNMVKYLIEKYNGDPTKVYATGSSSGCMMTNVLLAVYPDVFAAGSCYSGVAAGCLAGSPGSSPQSADPTCASGQNVKTGEQWAEQAKAMYPGFTGSYPRMQTFHGTADHFVDYKNLAEQLKEWSALLGVEFTKNVTNTPQSGYTQMVYGDGTKLVGYSAANVGHTVPVHPQLDVAWFGLE